MAWSLLLMSSGPKPDVVGQRHARSIVYEGVEIVNTYEEVGRCLVDR